MSYLPGLPMPSTPPAKIDGLNVAARASVILLGTTIALNVVGAVLTLLEANARERAVDDSLALAQIGESLLYLAVVLGTAAAFVTWLFIAIKNLVIWRTGIGWAPGWAIGAWFIPLANLVLPFLVVSATARSSEDPYAPQPRVSASILTAAWWGTFVLSGCCTNYTARQGLQGGTLRVESTLSALDVVGSVGYILAAVLAIILVRRITRQQEQRQAGLDAGWQQTLIPHPGGVGTPPPPIVGTPPPPIVGTPPPPIVGTPPAV